MDEICAGTFAVFANVTVWKNTWRFTIFGMGDNGYVPLITAVAVLITQNKKIGILEWTKRPRTAGSGREKNRLVSGFFWHSWYALLFYALLFFLSRARFFYLQK